MYKKTFNFNWNTHEWKVINRNIGHGNVHLVKRVLRKDDIETNTHIPGEIVLQTQPRQEPTPGKVCKSGSSSALQCMGWTTQLSYPSTQTIFLIYTARSTQVVDNCYLVPKIVWQFLWHGYKCICLNLNAAATFNTISYKIKMVQINNFMFKCRHYTSGYGTCCLPVRLNVRHIWLHSCVQTSAYCTY